MRKKDSTGETTILHLRGIQKDLVRKIKASAALKGEGLSDYVQEVLSDHVSSLEKSGRLPKNSA